MKNKDNVSENVEIDETKPESAEEIRATIRELEKKAAAIEAEEDEERVEKVQLPIAKAHVKLSAGQTVNLEMVTPPEVLLLAALHNKGAGGNPILELTPTGTVETDPISERNRLVMKYGAERVEKLFPGSDPKFPKSFRRAIQIGIGTVLPMKTMFDFHVKPMNAVAA